MWVHNFIFEKYIFLIHQELSRLKVHLRRCQKSRQWKLHSSAKLWVLGKWCCHQHCPRSCQRKFAVGNFPLCIQTTKDLLVLGTLGLLCQSRIVDRWNDSSRCLWKSRCVCCSTWRLRQCCWANPNWKCFVGKLTGRVAYDSDQISSIGHPYRK